MPVEDPEINASLQPTPLLNSSRRGKPSLVS